MATMTDDENKKKNLHNIYLVDINAVYVVNKYKIKAFKYKDKRFGNRER